MAYAIRYSNQEREMTPNETITVILLNSLGCELDRLRCHSRKNVAAVLVGWSDTLSDGDTIRVVVKE